LGIINELPIIVPLIYNIAILFGFLDCWDWYIYLWVFKLGNYWK